ncbi:MAG: peptidase M14, partial [Saprospiraceae bacterium]|nr:peptidase M14 [Saprospiraceae bacterium]
MPNLSLLIAAILCVSWEALAQLTFLDTYQDYQESVITDRRFKHHEIKPLILALPDSLFEVKVAGRSIEGREIYLIKVGRGSTKVLLWSQM